MKNQSIQMFLYKPAEHDYPELLHAIWEKRMLLNGDWLTDLCI